MVFFFTLGSSQKYNFKQIAMLKVKVHWAKASNQMKNWIKPTGMQHSFLRQTLFVMKKVNFD